MKTAKRVNRGTNLLSSPPLQPQQPQQPPPPPQPPQPPPTIPGKESEKEKKEKKKKKDKVDEPPDMNKSNPRLLVNRESIYERQLPGDAYITVYVQRLQHGYYSSTAVSDTEAKHVDFLALSFVFHSPHTLSHRFKSATIRASIEGPDQLATDIPFGPKYRPQNPRILMHAPHLIYGTVSPETMEWTFSLAGSIGISETPLSANLIPSGSVNSRYRRYEMMRIQGSARTLKSPRNPQLDIEAGEVVWSLEENNLQRSGLPREFTFVMLIQKPTPKYRVKLSLEIDPVIQSWWGNYPSWSLNLPSYRPAKRRDVDFNKEVGQKFEPVDTERGFNFATLVSQFDDYIAMPGRKYSRRMEIPKETDPPEGGFRQGYPGQYGSLNPMQGMQGMQGSQGTQGNQGIPGIQAGFQGIQQRYQMQSTAEPPLTNFPAAPSLSTNMINATGLESQPNNNNLNLSLGPSHGVAIMNLSALRSAMVSPRQMQMQQHQAQSPAKTQSQSQSQRDPDKSDTRIDPNTALTLTKKVSEKDTQDKDKDKAQAQDKDKVKDTEDVDINTSTKGPGEWLYKIPESDPGIEIETIRSRMLQTVHWSSPPKNRRSSNDVSLETERVMITSNENENEMGSIMNMVNRPLTPSLLLRGDRHGGDDGNKDEGEVEDKDGHEREARG